MVGRRQPYGHGYAPCRHLTQYRRQPRLPIGIAGLHILHVSVEGKYRLLRITYPPCAANFLELRLGEVHRIPLPRRWVNRRYDASSVDDPGYTDTVREDFDRIADLSEAEGWDRRVLMGPRRPGCR